MMLNRTGGITLRLQAAIIFLGLLLATAPATAQQDVATTPELTLTILHTNDLHAHDEPFAERGRMIGGVARIAHLIRSIRKTTANVLAVDAGDIFQGTPFFKLYHGEVEVQALNKAGYDVYTIGNHEFDEGPDNLARQLSLAKFDIVSCNLDASAAPELARLVKRSVVKGIDGHKVAFIGAITPDLESLSPAGSGIRVIGSDSDWIAPIREEVERLRSQGIDKIVLVTHVGVKLDRQIAEAIPAIDAIVGGHSHTPLYKPVVVPHQDGSHTIIVQTGCYGRNLGKLVLAFDGEGKLIMPQTSSRLIRITDRIPEDPEVRAYVQEKGRPLQAMKNKVVGVALGDFDNRFYLCPGDSPLGDLICDALAEAGAGYGVTISLHNRGGIRGRIERGLITQEKIEEVLPFDNHLTFATVSGATIKKALELSVSGGRGGRFLDVHGLRLSYDPSKPAGQRVTELLVEDASGNWRPLDPAARYKIAVNDFTFAGGEGYEFPDAAEVVKTGERLSSVLASYLIKHKKVRPQEPSRISALPSTEAPCAPGNKAGAATRMKSGPTAGSGSRSQPVRDRGVRQTEQVGARGDPTAVPALP